MNSIPFLHRLTIQLLAGAVSLPEELVAPHRSFLIDHQNQDGGWSGREGMSDLYYTGFALRSLAILGELSGELAERATRFLRHSARSPQSIVDLISLIYGGHLIAAATDLKPFDGFALDWSDRIVNFLDKLRRSDGGFAKSPNSLLGSSYQTFLVVLCRELLEKPLAKDDHCIEFLKGQCQDDGGFLEVRVAKRSGTNPTAAAAVALNCLDALGAEGKENTIRFLLEMQSAEGGFSANQSMPLEDLLSTFTALVTLWEFEAIERAELDKARDYVLNMQRSGGGFAGFALDNAKDVEYTFYGLGSLALLNHYTNIGVAS